jgi:hypothetical protein
MTPGYTALIRPRVASSSRRAVDSLCLLDGCAFPFRVGGSTVAVLMVVDALQMTGPDGPAVRHAVPG